MLAMENIFKEQPIEVMIGEAPDATREQDDDDDPPWSHPFTVQPMDPSYDISKANISSPWGPKYEQQVRDRTTRRASSAQTGARDATESEAQAGYSPPQAALPRDQRPRRRSRAPQETPRSRPVRLAANSAVILSNWPPTTASSS